MDMPTRQWGEMLTGLGAAGVEVIVGHIVEQPMFGHPLIPVLQITTDEATFIRYVTELDAAYRPGKLLAQSLLDDLGQTLIGQKKLRFQQTGNTDFQIARGLLGVSV
jgi:hypothetical protein